MVYNDFLAITKKDHSNGVAPGAAGLHFKPDMAIVDPHHDRKGIGRIQKDKEAQCALSYSHTNINTIIKRYDKRKQKIPSACFALDNRPSEVSGLSSKNGTCRGQIRGNG